MYIFYCVDGSFTEVAGVFFSAKTLTKCSPQRHQTLHRTRSVRPVSGTCWGIHTGPTHSNVSESGDVRLVVHCRSAHGIGRRERPVAHVR